MVKPSTKTYFAQISGLREQFERLRGKLDQWDESLKNEGDEIARAVKEERYDYDEHWPHELRRISHLLSRLSRNQVGFLQLDEGDLRDIRGYQVTLNEITDYLLKHGAS